jgi:hypothetical protein
LGLPLFCGEPRRGGADLGCDDYLAKHAQARPWAAILSFLFNTTILALAVNVGSCGATSTPNRFLTALADAVAADEVAINSLVTFLLFAYALC